MKYITKFLKDKKTYFLNIFLVLTIFLIALALKNIYPFGKNSFATIDANIQYQPMLYNFIEKLKTGLLENYTFNSFFGQPTAFNYVYYLSSPFNIFGIFFKSPEAIFFFPTLIRIIVGTISTTFYIKQKTKSNFITTIGTIGYIFSGWFFCYYHFNIWLDIFMLFPLFQYSLENLLKNQKCKLYIILLTIILISNFYIGFMVCLYTLIYFIIYAITNKDSIKNKIYNFQLITLSTIIVLLLSFAHLYVIYDCFTKAKIIPSQTLEQFLTSAKKLLASIFYGQATYLTKDGNLAPNICTSILFTINFLYYFINKKIFLKDKIKTIILILFVIFLLFSPTADLIINCFHIPNGFPYRYSFIISFWYIYLFIKNFKTFEYTIDKKIFIINILLLILLITLYATNILNTNIFFLNLAFLLAYTIFFIFYNKNKLYKYILIILIIIESICALSTTLSVKTAEKIYTKEFEITKYRIPTTQKNHFNQKLYSNENNISMFSSMNYKTMLINSIWFDIGSDNNAFTNTYNSGQVFNMFFNIKTDSPLYLEKIFAVDKKFKELELNGGKIIFNEMVYYATGYKNALEKIDITYSPKETVITIEEDGYYRIKPYDTCNIIFKDKDKIIYEAEKNESLPAETLYLKKGNQIIVSGYKDITENPALLYKENDDVIKKAHEKLSKNQISYTHYSDSHIEGTIAVDKDQVIFTSIPYDKDWEIFIDGKKAQQIKILGDFMGIECEKGNHTISLKYNTHYEIPILISLGTAVSMIIHEITKRKKQKDTNFA